MYEEHGRIARATAEKLAREARRADIHRRLEALAKSAAIEPCYWEDAEGQNAIRLKELADLGRELAELDGEGKG